MSDQSTVIERSDPDDDEGEFIDVEGVLVTLDNAEEEMEAAHAALRNLVEGLTEELEQARSTSYEEEFESLTLEVDEASETLARALYPDDTDGLDLAELAEAAAAIIAKLQTSAADLAAEVRVYQRLFPGAVPNGNGNVADPEAKISARERLAQLVAEPTPQFTTVELPEQVDGNQPQLFDDDHQEGEAGA